MRYRTEIDGLRAIAIIPVVLFHAGFELFSGGFLGVDIFFVISGYLITSIILSDMDKGRFSLLNFYERRARRILPALFLVMILCIPPAVISFSSQDLKDFGQSLIATALFSSNFLFWKESGYFTGEAELKPLLHTWSLAVEGQYYILFPLLLIFTKRLKAYWTPTILVIATILSLGFSQWLSTKNIFANFFITPSRIWEILIGSLVALYLFKKTIKGNQSLSLLGLLMVFYSFFKFDSSIHMPNIYSLVPTIGTALIILFTSSHTLSYTLLTNRFCVFIGLISYSAYLWHYPIFAFVKYHNYTTPPVTFMLFLSFISLVFGYISYRFVETPFRQKNVVRKHLLVCCSIFMLTIFFLLGLSVHLSKGLPHRANTEGPLFEKRTPPGVDIYKRAKCYLEEDKDFTHFSEDCGKKTKEKILIWGDSFAKALVLGLRKIYPSINQFSASACPPLINYASFPTRIHCKGVNDFVLNWVIQNQPKKIILAARWNAPYHTFKIKDIANSIEALQKHAPYSTIYVMGMPPQWKPNLQTHLLRHDIDLDKRNSLKLPYYKEQKEYEQTLRSKTISKNTKFISILDTLCSEDTCPATTQYGLEFYTTSWDGRHLSPAASMNLAPLIEPLIFDENTQAAQKPIN
jgi:peptidoglycan/LPS O-acetylase OafA/YrhL